MRLTRNPVAHSLNRALVLPVLALGLVAGGAAIGAATHEGSDPRPPSLTEDHPLWDCATMGNLTCIPVTDPDVQAAGWAAYDRENWGALLPVNPDRAYRVDLVAHSLTPVPDGDTSRALYDHVSGSWFVFNVSYTS